ncbi:MAG: transcription antitermination protein NusB [Bacteroidales bacterium]|nr:transcription antitermination protein NusB [Bacteroidales bacterium]
MLSRHFYRAKALQAVYAFRTSDASDTAVGELRFAYHIKHLNDLSTFQLDALMRFVAVVDRMQQDAKRKFMPTQDDLNPSRNLVENSFMAILAANSELSARRSGVTEVPDIDSVLKKAYIAYRDNNAYKTYSRLKQPTFDDDKQAVLALFKYLMNYEPLIDLISERSLLWDDDFAQIAQLNFAMLRGIEASAADDFPMPPAYDESSPKEQEDYEFGRRLFMHTLHHFDENEPLIRKYLQGWEYDRIPLVDIIIINLAVTELTTCPTVPVIVTIDECVELAKEFSSDKSRLFVNGIIDKIVADLRSQRRIGDK